MNDRESRPHLIKLRLRERKEFQAANAAVKKPPATAKSQKAKKRRSAYAGVTQNLGFPRKDQPVEDPGGFPRTGVCVQCSIAGRDPAANGFSLPV